jgi:hypothetical protein
MTGVLSFPGVIGEKRCQEIIDYLVLILDDDGTYMYVRTSEGSNVEAACYINVIWG